MIKPILSENLQIWGFEDDLTLFSDGSLGFALECIPKDITCYDDNAINDLSSRLGQLLNGLPTGIDIQFLQEIKPGNKNIIDSHSSLKKENDNILLNSLFNERVKKFKDLDDSGRLPFHGLKVFVRRPLKKKVLSKLKLFQKTTNFEKTAIDKMKAEASETRRLRNDLISSLSSIDINTQLISSKELAKIIYEQWNPARTNKLKEYDPENFRDSILFTDIEVKENHFLMSNFHHKVVSLKLLPDQTFTSMSRALRELPFSSRLFLSIHVPDQQKEIESLQASRRIAYSMVSGKKGARDIDSEAKLQDLETLLEDMVTSGEKVFHVSLNVVLTSTDLSDLDDQVSQTIMRLRDLSGTEGMEETVACFEVFKELSIPNARGTIRKKRLKTSNLADFIPIYGPWRGHKQASLLLKSRRDSLVAFDPFSQDLTNYNQIISGGSGSGKSFLANTLLLQMMKENPKVYIVDIGGSYKKLCNNLDGQYVPLEVNTDIAINPFDLPKNETKPSSQKIKFLLGLVELMTKETDASGLNKLQRSILEETIQEVYETSDEPILTDLKNHLLKSDLPEISRLGKILNSWCGNTAFGKIIDRKTSIKLEKNIVSFDLKGMESYPDLQTVCLFLITDLVWRDFQNDRSTKKFLILDECWKIINTDSGSAFIAEAFRTFRKYYAGAIAITQNIDDIANSKVASAILPNSSVKWLLMQKGADRNRLKEVLHLNENEAEQIASLTQKRGYYSECFLMAEGNRAVVAVETSPLEYWIATTDPRDLSKIDDYQSHNKDLSSFQVLKALSEKYPHGVAINKEERS